MIQATELLLSSGANMDVQDPNGQSPMHRAASRNNIGAIDCIIRHEGIEAARTLDFKGNSPTELALAIESAEAVKHLTCILGQGSKPNNFEDEFQGPRNASSVRNGGGLVKEEIKKMKRLGAWMNVWIGSILIILLCLGIGLNRS